MARVKIAEFGIIQKPLASAVVTFYTANADGSSTGVKATLYQASTGAAARQNPQTLDTEGKLSDDCWVASAVVGAISGITVATERSVRKIRQNPLEFQLPVTCAAYNYQISSDVLADAGVLVIAADLEGANTIGAVAAVADEVETVAVIAADVTAVAAIDTDVTTVADNIADVQGAAGNAATAVAAAAAAALSAAAADEDADFVAQAWQGAWVTATPYLAGQSVGNGGSSYICSAAHTSGAATEPGTGASWQSVWGLLASKGAPGAGTGDMIGANNLSDVDDVATARANLGVAIGVNVQAYDAELAALAGLTSAADKLPYFTGSETADVATFTAAGRALLDDANATAQRSTLGLGTAAVAALIDEDDMASNSATALPSQQSVKAYVDSSLSGVGGALVLLGSYTASNATSVDIGAGLDLDATIDGTYDEYELHIVGLVPASDDMDVLLRTSTNGGVAFDVGASDYMWGMSGYSSAATIGNYGDNEDTKINLNMPTASGNLGVGNAAGEHFNTVIKIFNPSSTSLFTMVSFISTFFLSGGDIISVCGNGAREAAANVDALRILMSSGNITSGIFHIYGVKKV